jgi:hypothetical protein
MGIRQLSARVQQRPVDVNGEEADHRGGQGG